MIDPITGAAAISAGANLVGGLVSSSGARSGAKAQQEFEKYMSNTAYQRAVKDLQLAGLNPVLAAMKGGASTPSVDAVNPRAALGEAIGSSAKALTADRIRLRNETQLATTQADLNRENSAKAASETTLNNQRLQTELALGAKLTEEANEALIRQQLLESQNIQTRTATARTQQEIEAGGYDMERKKFISNVVKPANWAAGIAGSTARFISDGLKAITGDKEKESSAFSADVLGAVDQLTTKTQLDDFAARMEQNIKSAPDSPMVEAWRRGLWVALQKRAKLGD